MITSTKKFLLLLMSMLFSKKGGTYHPNYLDKNCNSTQKFSANMPDNKTVGDKTDIMFTCSAGKIIWEYKLVNK